MRSDSNRRTRDAPPATGKQVFAGCSRGASCWSARIKVKQMRSLHAWFHFVSLSLVPPAMLCAWAAGPWKSLAALLSLSLHPGVATAAHSPAQRVAHTTIPYTACDWCVLVRFLALEWMNRRVLGCAQFEQSNSTGALSLPLPRTPLCTPTQRASNRCPHRRRSMLACCLRFVPEVTVDCSRSEGTSGHSQPHRAARQRKRKRFAAIRSSRITPPGKEFKTVEGTQRT
jgi:hypothetical protein